MRIIIETIHHQHQRYPTVGDWQIDPYTQALTILVSETGSFTYNYLVAMHELAEAMWCLRHGVSQAAVDKWDTYYENMRQADPTNPQYQGEPGNNPEAPYHLGHRLGDIIERLMACHLDVNWQTYEANLNDMDDRYGRPARHQHQTRLSGETAALHLGGSGLPSGDRSAHRDYGRRETIIREAYPLETRFQAGGNQESEEEGIKTPKTDTRVPRRQHEEHLPVKTPPQDPKKDPGTRDGW